MVGTTRMQCTLTGLLTAALCVVAVAESSLDDELTLTYHQKQVLDKFRARVENQLSQDYMKHDLYLVHWLRATNFDLRVAEKQLLANLEWRRENNVDTIETLDWSDFTSEYPYTTSVYDKEGRPTLIFNFGDWDIRKAAVSGQSSRMILYWAKLMEELTAKIRSLHGKNVTQGNVIVAETLTLYNILVHNVSIHVYLGLISLFRNNYPGDIHKAHLVNAPRQFRTLMKILVPSPARNDNDNSGFQIYGTNQQEWQEALLQEYTSEQLPLEFGGTNRKLADLAS